MAEKLAPQSKFNELINPSWWQTTGIKAADTATLGYLPNMINYMNPDIPVEGARKMIDAAAEENPWSARAGQALGVGYDALAAAAGTGALATGLGVGAGAAPSIYAARLGLAAAPEAAPAMGLVARAATMPARALSEFGPNALGLTKAGVGLAAKAIKPALAVSTLGGLGTVANYLLGADTAQQAGTNEPPKPLGPRTGNVATPSPAVRTVPELAQVMDEYEAVHPGNRGGPMTDDQYDAYRQAASAKEPQTVPNAVEMGRAKEQAAEQSRLNYWIRTGAQIGINDPDTAVAFGRSGGYTPALLKDALISQQGRVTQRMGYRDLAWAQANQELDAEQARYEKHLTGQALVDALTTLNTRRKRLQDQALSPGVLPPQLIDVQNATGQ